MRRLLRADVRIMYAFICVCLLLGSVGVYASGAPEAYGASGPAQNIDEENPPLHTAPLEQCETPEQLLSLLEKNSGGKITLTGNIAWDISGSLYSDNPTTIEMGEYGVTVSADLILEKGLRFEGDGNPEPMFTVEPGGSLIISGASLESVSDNAVTLYARPGGYIGWFAGTRIAALGNEAVAVYSADDVWIMNDCVIEAPGRGGAGISTAGGANIQYAVITAGDVGVQAAGSVRVFYSVIKAGNDAVRSDAGIVLDCAEASPEPEGARVVKRVAIPYDLNNLAAYGFCVEPGEAPETMDSLLYRLVDKDGAEDFESVYLPVRWENGGDNNAPGKYSLYVTASERILDIEGFERAEIPLYVVDPLVPWLTYAECWDSGGIIFFFREILDAEDIRLLYSEDEGDTWLDAKTDFNAEISGSNAVISGLDNERVTWFRLSVTGGPMAGESNILKVSGDFMALAGDNRDGGDREGAEALPPVTSPIGTPPKETEEDSHGQHEPPGQSEQPDSPAQTDQPGKDADIDLPEIESENDEVLPEDPETDLPQGSPPSEEGGAALPAQAAAQPPLAYPYGSLAYSAGEIDDLISANPKRLVFISNGMRAVIPTYALKYALDGKASFAIWMERSEDDRFAIRMFVGNAELYELDGEEFQIHVPFDGGGDIYCADETGYGVPVRVEGKMAVCGLLRTGSYLLYVEHEDNAPGASQSNPYQKQDGRPSVRSEAGANNSRALWAWALLPAAAAALPALRALRRARGRWPVE